MAYGSGYATGFMDGPIIAPAETDEQIAAHEIAGLEVNVDALFPIDRLTPQEYGCGNGYAGGPIAALMYGGAVPCNGQSPASVENIQSNVEDFCRLDYTCS